MRTGPRAVFTSGVCLINTIFTEEPTKLLVPQLGTGATQEENIGLVIEESHQDNFYTFRQQVDNMKKMYMDL